MELTDAAKRLRAQLAVQRDQVDAAELHLAAARRVHSKTEELLRAVLQAAEELGEPILDEYEEPVPTAAANEWNDLERTDAVLRVLSELDRAMSPVEVQEELLKRGRSDSYDVVGSTLAYLKKNGKVVQPERGLYRLTPASGSFVSIALGELASHLGEASKVNPNRQWEVLREQIRKRQAEQSADSVAFGPGHPKEDTVK